MVQACDVNVMNVRTKDKRMSWENIIIFEFDGCPWRGCVMSNYLIGGWM